MGNNYLSEVLTTQDILSVNNNKICIFAGVGSGKNWFVEHELIKEGNILYVSSRRAKVNEILEEKLAQEFISWDKESEDLVTTTNYGIEKLVMNEKFGHRLSEIIRHFSFIVIDEAHSISTDASYADSSFHLLKFLQYVNLEYPQIKIILMTGTPEPLQSIPNFIKKCHIFDKREDCINIVPKKIRFIKKKDAISLIASLPNNSKTIYYSNSARKIVAGNNALRNQLIASGINENEICICMSQNSIVKNKKHLPSLPEVCENTKISIAQNKTLPESARILLTTSTLKEGVNIEDVTINIAFCETHLLSDIQQFAGRVRTSIDTLYIIQETEQHDVTHSVYQSYILETLYSNKYILSSANDFLENTLLNPEAALYDATGYNPGDVDWSFIMEGEYSLYSYGGEAIKAFIKLIESKFQYIKFDHLIGKFAYFNTRFIEQKRIHTAIHYKHWLSDLENYCMKYNIAYELPSSDDEIDIAAIKEYLENNSNVKITGDKRNELKSFLASAFHLTSTTPQINTLNKNLSSIDLPYEIKQGNTSSKRSNKRYLCIEEL